MRLQITINCFPLKSADHSHCMSCVIFHSIPYILNTDTLNVWCAIIYSTTLYDSSIGSLCGRGCLEWWMANFLWCACCWCLSLRAGYKDTLIVHMFIYNTAFSLWMDKKKNLPSRQYTLYHYVHTMQYACFSYIRPLYAMSTAVIANAPHICCALASVVYWSLSHRPYLLLLMTSA